MSEPINQVHQGTLIRTMNEYQQVATNFAIYPGKGHFLGLVYTALKMNGEAGEIAEKVGKIMRDDASILSEEKRAALLLELGDVLWYIAACAKELGYSLEQVANANIEKLASRSARGKLQGSGDNR
jgi:NTP pyrophosphatase (non-canonical NTP hydrolase)